MVDCGNIEKSWDAFKTAVLAAENKHTQEYWLPLPKTLTFIPKEVIRARRKKKKAWTKYIKCRSDNHYDMFKKCRNILGNLIWEIIENHEKAITADAQQKSKGF